MVEPGSFSSLYITIVFLLMVYMYDPVCCLTQCFATAVQPHDSTRYLPRQINESLQMATSNSISDMEVCVCPEGNSLKISWETNKTLHDVNVCFSMRAMFNWKLLGTYCYQVQPNANFTSMTCWFDVDPEVMETKPIIDAWTNGVETHFGHLNTAILDDVNESCILKKDICTLHQIVLENQLICNKVVQLSHHVQVSIRHLTFSAINRENCELTELPFTKQRQNQREFIMNCGFNGPGILNIVYSIHGVYCKTTIKVKSFCWPAETTLTPSYLEQTITNNNYPAIMAATLSSIIIAILILIVIAWKLRKSSEPAGRSTRNEDLEHESSRFIHSNEPNITII